MNYMNARNCMSNMNNQSVRQNFHHNTPCPAMSSAVHETAKSGSGSGYAADCCPDAEYNREYHMPEIPTGNQKQLFNFINEVSFAAYEALLFLDTHPDDQEALAYFHKYNHLRNAALKEYARRFGPLTISTADDHSSKCWEWMNQPWPWEGGIC